VRPRSAAASTWAKLPSRTTSGSEDASCRTIQGSSPSLTRRFEPPPRNRGGTPWESRRLSRAGMDSFFLMRRRYVLPPMLRDVSSLSEEAGRSSTSSSRRAATNLGSSMRMGSRSGVLGSQQDHEFVAGAADVTGADGQDGVQGARLAQQEFDAFLHGTEIEDILVAGFADGIGQRFAGYARDGRLAGSVDVGDNQNVGLVERAREFVPEMLRARVAVRLEKHQETIELADARGFQGGADLGRVMAVVVDHGNVVDRAFNVEAPTNAGKFAQAFANQFGGNVEIERDRGGGSGVAHVVDARGMEELENAEIVAFVGQPKFAAQPFELDVTDDQISLAGCAVSDDGALNAGNDGLHVGLIEAENRRAIEGHAIDELHEGVLNVFERGILIEMFPVDGGDNGDHRCEEQKSAVAFIRFDGEKFTFAKSRGGARLVDPAANDKRRIEMRSGQDGRNDGGGGRFPVRASYCDAVFQAHQLRQHFRTRDNRNLFLVRLDNFGIVGFDRRRSHHHVRAFHIRGFMAFVNGGAEILQ